MREEHDNLIRGSLDFNGSGSDEEDEEILIGDNTKNNSGGNKLNYILLDVKICLRNSAMLTFLKNCKTRHSFD